MYGEEPMDKQLQVTVQCGLFGQRLDYVPPNPSLAI